METAARRASKKPPLKKNPTCLEISRPSKSTPETSFSPQAEPYPDSNHQQKSLTNTKRHREAQHRPETKPRVPGHDYPRLSAPGRRTFRRTALSVRVSGQCGCWFKLFGLCADTPNIINALPVHLPRQVCLFVCSCAVCACC